MVKYRKKKCLHFFLTSCNFHYTIQKDETYPTAFLSQQMLKKNISS